MGLVISAKVEQKLGDKHRVSRSEVLECFANRCGAELEDTRENHATDPPTRWFIARTNHRRLLKVVYVRRGADIHLRTAYEPNSDELTIYRRFGGDTE
jgi:nuclear transport factor 2 (NTF2) superfamily protein